MGKSINPVKLTKINSKFFALQEVHFRMGNLKFFKNLEELFEDFQSRKVFNSSSVESLVQDKNVILGPDFIEYAKDTSYEVDFSLDYLLKLQLKKLSWETVLKNEGNYRFSLSEYNAWIAFYALVVEPKIGKELLGVSVGYFETRYFSFKRKEIWANQPLIMKINNLSPVIKVDILRDLPNMNHVKEGQMLHLIRR